MIFQYPSFLWALASLAIPIIIHLFNFRKTTRIYFSNTRLLRQVKQETTQKRKLKQYLVLASRLLFLAFLVLAFAQPLIPAKEQIGSQKNIAVYLDNSLSMSAPVGEKTRALDAGIQMVDEIINLFPSDVRYQLITNDFAPFSNSYKTRTEVLEFLSQIRLSSISRDVNEITSRLLEKNGSLFWISDLQRSTFGNLTKIDSSLQIKLSPIKIKQLSNVLIDTVYLENPLVNGGEKNSVKVKLQNDGSRLVEGLVVKLTINGIQASAATVAIEPNSSNIISFDITSINKGINKAQLSFSDYPVSFDNEFFFTLNYTGKLKVVEITGSKEAVSVATVYGNKDLFSFATFKASNLNYSMLGAADLIVLNQLDKIETSLLSALSSLKNDHCILVIPGIKPDAESYGNLISTKLVINQEEKPQQLSIPDFKNPLFQNVFEEKNVSMAMPTGSKQVDWGADRSAILQLKDGRPFLSQFGNVYLLACPLVKEATDFYNHALFVPVMYRLAVLGSRSEQRPYYNLSSTLISFAADSLIGEEPIKMLGKQEVIPMQRRNGNQVVLEIPKFLLDKGFYTLIHKKDTLDVVAFNLDKSESLLASLSAEEAKLRLGGGKSISIFEAGNPEAFSNEIKERYLGTPLWKYALILALLFLLAEVLLILFLK